MIDWVKHMVPGLKFIEVCLTRRRRKYPRRWCSGPHRDDIGSGDDPTHRHWIDWLATTFEPAVCQNFTLLSVYHDHGR